MRYGAATDIGQVRDHNEDAFFSDPDCGLYVVSDGMGGHEGGEVASGIVVDSFARLALRGGSLTEGVLEAHQAVLHGAAIGEGKPGMGATVVALRVRGLSYEIAWAGDSRAYLWDGSALRQITTDHSFVQELVNQGAITADEALIHPRRNLITRAVGRGAIDESLEVDYMTGEGQPGWRILLCSDGLSGEVTDNEIAAILARCPVPQDAVSALITAANSNGGSDNITVAVVTLVDE